MSNAIDTKVQELLSTRNFLGALAAIKEANLETVEENIQIGRLAQAITAEIDHCRSTDKFEQARFSRALLAYCLRDYPGLSALYREQTEAAGFSLREDLKRFSRTISDMASGKVSMEAGLKEGFDNANRRAAEAGFSVNNVVKNVEDGIKQGLNGLASFFDSLGNTVPNDPLQPTTQDDVAAEDDHGESIKVTIQNKDKPLPDDVQPVQDDPTDPHTKSKRK
jgi:hypothetical protein